MSVDVSRDGAITNKQHEIASASRSQFASLLALRAVTALVSNNGTLSSLFGADYSDPDNTSSFDDDELQWIKRNTLPHGQRFDESTLPIPVIEHDNITAQHASDITDRPLLASGSHGSHGINVENVNPAIGKLSDDDSQQNQPISSKLRSTDPTKTRDGELMNDIAPPEPEEQAEFDDKTKKLVESETPKRPARTVHLPPEDVQEERLSHRLEEARRPSNCSNLEKAQKLHHNQAEAASSPSSTVGAYSAATPMPPQDSPDTSPDTETGDANIPAEFRPSPTERRAKEEHDRLLEAQKAIAHQAALGDISTPDDQLKWEEREAASRDAEEKSAAEERKRQQSSLRALAVETENNKSVDSTLSGQNVITAPEAESPDDTIAVKAPTQSKPDSARPISSGSTASRPVSRSRVSDAARRGSEAASTMALRRRSSLEAVSPVISQRKLSTPKRPSFSQIQGNELSQRDMLHDLESIKGAAEDPDRDYLEPLFKIQAHDSPHINSHALPELVRGAYKTISTEDQFTAIHERMEYRILRRIYHLENANKWSLRQMEKCKEPPQPVSHHDHMMAEMKWMCKDFRAERKRKKSVCAWLAQRCAEWIAADDEERLQLQVRVKGHEEETADVPELDEDGDSPVNDAAIPATPPEHETMITRLVVDAELLDSVRELQQKGALTRALKQIPVWRPAELDNTTAVPMQAMTKVSKFVGGKVIPQIPHPIKKRSRYDYESESEEEFDRPSKKSREERALPPEGPDVAIFHPDNKPIRDRLHAANAFRPPSEFQMPTVSFYEFRNGSQWILEDDQKLRKLARDHSFNWSIIADQMQLPSRFKSGMERRTPWECFERWVELEQMPAEMRKTVYFKTWYARLEQSQQAVERRYQAQLAQVNAQAAQGTTPQHQPVRRRTTPMRVEKRKNTRYLWSIDAMRKNAKKRELAAYKQAEATRAAAQRKASQQNENPQPRRSMPTPQELSQKRYERDLQLAEAHRLHRQKMIEAQRQAQIARAAQQQGLANGTAVQRQATGQNSGQQAQSVAAAQQLSNAQLTPQQRQALQLAAQNGQLNAAQANGQNVPQAQMQATTQNTTQQNLQRLAAQVQARQLTPQQQQAVMHSAGVTGQNWQALTPQQQAALMAAYTQKQQRSANSAAMAQASQQQTSASPSMPPPPAPTNTTQQLSSGHVPALFTVKNMFRAKHPQLTEDQLNQYATEYLKREQASSSRQSAINAAAGINNAQGNTNQSTPNMVSYGHTQGQFPNSTGVSYNPDGTQSNGSNSIANNQRDYKMLMHQRQMAQLRLGQGSPQTGHAIPNGSPNMHHASPNMAPVSPNVQFANMAGQRPPSRSATPQMQRLGSSGSVPGVAVSGMQSPGAVNMQGSPQNMHANMAR